MAAFPWNPERQDPRLERFRKAYRERFGPEAETYAAHAYDGMNLMLWAINVAGLNRARIRDLIAYLPHPWPGVTGDIVLSACLDDVGDTYLAKFENGEWNYASRTDLGIPKGYIAPRDRLNRTPRRRAVRREAAAEVTSRRDVPALAAALGSGRCAAAARRRRGSLGPSDRCAPRTPSPTRRPRASRSTSGVRGARRPSPPSTRSCSAGSARPTRTTPLRRLLARAPSALEAGERAGGYRGAPFRLVPAWSESPWQAGIGQLTRLVYEEGAWAVIGGVDGATTHLAEQVALKARFPLLSPGSTDATANCANVPWLFTRPVRRTAGAGAGRAAARRAAAAASRSSPATTTIRTRRSSPPSRDGGAAAHARDARGVGRRRARVGPLAVQVLGAQPSVVLVIGPAQGRPVSSWSCGGAAFEGRSLAVRRSRRAVRPGGRGFGGGCDRAAAARDGAGVGGLRAPLRGALARGAGRGRGAGPRRRAPRGGAVRAAGLNRARIGDALRALAPWSGAAGSVRWDALGGNLRPVGLARWHEGRLVPFPG